MSWNSFFCYALGHKAFLQMETSDRVAWSSFHPRSQRDPAGTCEEVLETQGTHNLYKHIPIAAEL